MLQEALPNTHMVEPQLSPVTIVYALTLKSPTFPIL